MCRMRRFLAVLRSFFHSSLLSTFTCHPSPPTILPSSLTSSCHLFLGLTLNLVVPKFIYNTLLGILFSSILCTCPNQRNLINFTVSIIVGFFKLTYVLTYSMVQSPSSEANWFAASQEIPRLLWNPKVHYRTHKRPPTLPILCQPNPVHIPTSHLLEIHPNIIHPSTPKLHKFLYRLISSNFPFHCHILGLKFFYTLSFQKCSIAIYLSLLVSKFLMHMLTF